MPKAAGGIGAGACAIAVTGATGFIASHLLSRLDELKQPTRALVRAKPNRQVHLPSSTQVVMGALSSSEALQKLLKGAGTCIHLAGATKSINTSGFHTANVVGTYNVAAQAAAAGVEHFIMVSSQAARAPSLSDYAASKAASEAALSSFRSQMEITIIRPPAVIGPGDPMLQPMFDLIRWGWLPAPTEPRNSAREFAVISVLDLVNQIIAVARTPESVGDIIEPSSVPAANWRQVAQAVSEVQQHKVRLLPVPPGVLQALGRFGDGVAKVIRRPMPISYGKVQELLVADWTYNKPVRDAMSLKEIFEACFPDRS